MVLAFSRLMFVRPVLRMDQQAWTEAHVAAFEFFGGGVPRRLVPDNLRTGVDKPDLYDPRVTARRRFVMFSPISSRAARLLARTVKIRRLSRVCGHGCAWSKSSTSCTGGYPARAASSPSLRQQRHQT